MALVPLAMSNLGFQRVRTVTPMRVSNYYFEQKQF